MNQHSAGLVDGWQDAERWSTTRVAPHRQFECWRDFVNDAHMSWSISPLRCERFPAFVRQGRHAGYRVTHLTAEPGGVAGVRGRAEIARDREAFYNLLYVVDGSIGLSMERREVLLRPGHCALWDTTRPMRFVTGAHLRQLTLAVPQDRLRRVLPRADDHVLRSFDARSGLGRLFAEHLQSLDRCFGALPATAAGNVLQATEDLLVAALTDQLSPPGDGAAANPRLRQVLDYLHTHLDCPGLDTRHIAEAVGVSERHLHRLFEPLGATPAAWLRQQRLARCRQALISPACAHLSITDIALRWGFDDPGSFSKRFRRSFGISPRQWRAGAAAPGPDQR